MKCPRRNTRISDTVNKLKLVITGNKKKWLEDPCDRKIKYLQFNDFNGQIWIDL